MPDLSTKACHQFWFDYNDPVIYKVICFMESVENWTLENDDSVEAALQQLGHALDDIGQIDLQEEDFIIGLATFLKASQMLRLLQSLDTAHPGAASKLLMHAEETSSSEEDTPGLFLKRNVIFERLRLLTRICSPERMALILRAMENEGNNESN